MFSPEPLRKHIVLQPYHIHDLALQKSQTISKIRVLLSNSLVNFFLVLWYHQMEIRIAWDLAQFEILVGLGWHVEITLLRANFLICAVKFSFQCVLKLCDLHFFVAEVVAVLSLFILNLSDLLDELISFRLNFCVLFFVLFFLGLHPFLQVFLVTLKLLVPKLLGFELFGKFTVCRLKFV